MRRLRLGTIANLCKSPLGNQKWRAFTSAEVLQNRKDVGLLGVPFCGGQPRDGVEFGPQALREAGIKERIEGLQRSVHDYGDIDVDALEGDMDEVVYFRGTNIKRPTICGNVSRKIAEVVQQGCMDDRIMVTMGGDHSIATGSVFGHQQARGNICLLWIDAHNDLNTYETTGSGNLHGMSLAFLVNGLPDHSQLPGYEWTKPCLNPFDIAYIGLRDTDPGEHLYTHDLGIMTFSMHEIDRYGIATVVERAIESINPKLDRPIHISYDIDALDPSISPSTGTSVMGGLTIREGLYIGEYVNKLGLLGAMDIVEVNPTLAGGGENASMTTEAAIRLTEGCLGKHRSGYITHRSFEYAFDPSKNKN